MRIIIIEDEKPASRLLERKIEKLGFTVEIKLGSVEESIAWLSQHPAPDLIFLDIQLSDGLSFEIFEQVDVRSAIIFTTAYDEYALRAFKLNSIDYLLKPIQDKELQFAIQKYVDHKNSFFEFSDQINMFKKFIDSGNRPLYKERFSIKIGQQIKIVLTVDIACFYSENKATYIKTKDQRNYLIELSLDQVEALVAPDQFFRISRQFIVALSDIKDISVYSNSRLQLCLNNYKEEDLIVSRERVTEFKNWIG
ncbi:LytTR family DNA-binding domain-containing protein [Flavobacterium sp. NKUCC04_CG]|uniref:LytR/AlgR family response regulator transcription factor n=1 Tax=Flavobacterium sp. NKUCC04_CG TaxID=2842121 RepID=UPI001C5ABD08|nr:LytTR family DNA-binding domain-containing protein [Flavobacterium sp. NKUCC04_CG]MBW3520336.1 LytTR family DNA-binding domain-containing protein [Flavobacterium sp. NKUCC04_CG]